MSTTNRSPARKRLPWSSNRRMDFFRQVDRWGQNQSANLWLTVVLVAVLDLLTTYHGLQMGFLEVNPIARFGLVHLGFGSLMVMKGVALGVGAFNYRHLSQYRYLVPTTFISTWGVAVISNLALISNHVF